MSAREELTRLRAFWRSHVSAQYIDGSYEHRLRISISFTGKAKDLLRDFVLKPFRVAERRSYIAFLDDCHIQSGILEEHQLAKPKRTTTSWVDELPQTGVVRTPKFDNAAIVRHHTLQRQAAEAERERRVLTPHWP